MKISEAIKLLEHIKEKHGDICVGCVGYNYEMEFEMPTILRVGKNKGEFSIFEYQDDDLVAVFMPY